MDDLWNRVSSLSAPPRPEQLATYRELLSIAERLADDRHDSESVLLLGKLLAIHPDRLVNRIIHDRCVRVLSSVEGDVALVAEAKLELGFACYDTGEYATALGFFRDCDVGALHEIHARRCLELRACCVTWLAGIEAARPELDAVARYLREHPESWEEPLSLQAVYDKKGCAGVALSEETRQRLRALLLGQGESWFGGV